MANESTSAPGLGMHLDEYADEWAKDEGSPEETEGQAMRRKAAQDKADENREFVEAFKENESA